MQRWCWRRLGPSTTRTRRRRTTASSPPRGSQTPRPSGTTPCCWQSPRLSTNSRIKDRSLSLHRETQTSLPTGHIRSPFQFYQYLHIFHTALFRTSPLVLAEAKSIYSLYDTGNKWKVPSGDPEPSAYRTSTLLLPEAKSIYSLEDTGNKGGLSRSKCSNI